MRGMIKTTLALGLVLMAGTSAYGREIVISRGDLNRDGHITEADLMLFTEYHFGVTGSRPLEALDVDDNGKIDVTDYNILHKIVYFDPKTKPQQEKISFTRGDTNNDGKRDLADVVTLTRVLAGGRMKAAMDAADMDRDGLLTEADTLILLDKVMAQKQPTPQPKPPVDPDGKVDPKDQKK